MNQDDNEEILIMKYRKNQCGNCHATLKRGDKYCRYCGTKRGEGAFEPYRNIVETLYGPPPVKYSYHCKACGFEWTDIAMMNEEKFCPNCGSDQVTEATKGDQ